jgi:hypothetical protein
MATVMARPVSACGGERDLGQPIAWPTQKLRMLSSQLPQCESLVATPMGKLRQQPLLAKTMQYPQKNHL